MDLTRDVRLVFLALGDGLVDPAAFAAAGHDWPPRDTSLLDFLVARGWLSAEQRRRLEATAAGWPTADLDPGAVTADEGAGPDQPTPTFVGPAADRPGGPPPAGGRYRVTELYRSGGLGRVWRAEDTALGRIVALKTLRPDRARDPGVRARFVNEARITGQLEHPCVVPVYDLLTGGAEGATGPCYAMRFVAGRTLAEASHDYHARLAAGTATRLDLAGLLDAFVAVCRAVAYAHARHVLHRDLKGQNIILGEYGEVFVLDWGLAKLLEAEDAPGAVTPSPVGPRDETATGAVLGTPAFMAPELAVGRSATVASDVYALGGVLHVILTGRPPYDTGGVETVLDQVAKAPPLPPRAVNPAAPAALDAVCRKAMARDSAARYPTAEALAADVRSWLAGEPVGAYPEGLPARLARWGRRHRPAVFGAAAVLVTGVIALAVNTWSVLQEERRTAEQRDRAEQHFALAQNLSDNLLDLSEKHLAPVPQTEPARRAFLTDALQSYRRSLAERPDDRNLQAGTARLARYAGNVFRVSGSFGPAEDCFHEAVRLYETLTAARPDDAELRNLLAETLRDQSQLYAIRGRLRDAAAVLARAAAEADGLPEKYRYTAGTISLDRADVEYARGEWDAAAVAARRAVDLLRPLTDWPKARQPRYARMFLAAAFSQLAAAERDAGRPEAAWTAHGDAFKQFKIIAVGADRNEHHKYARVLVDRARTLEGRKTGRTRAEADYTAAIDIWTKLADDHPDNPTYRRWLAIALAGRGRLRVETDRKAAAADLERAETLAGELIEEADDVPDYYAAAGRVYAVQGRLAAAEGDATRAKKRFDLAADEFRTAADLAPEDALIRRDQAEAAADKSELTSSGP